MLTVCYPKSEFIELLAVQFQRLNENVRIAGFGFTGKICKIAIVSQDLSSRVWHEAELVTIGNIIQVNLGGEITGSLPVQSYKVQIWAIDESTGEKERLVNGKLIVNQGIKV